MQRYLRDPIAITPSTVYTNDSPEHGPFEASGTALLSVYRGLDARLDSRVKSALEATLR